MALAVLVSVTAMAFANENHKEENTDYLTAAQVMADAGMVDVSAAAANHDPSVNMALLAASDGMTLTQLTAQAIIWEREQRAADEMAAQKQMNEAVAAAVRAALLAEYDGVKASADWTVRSAPDGSAIRTIRKGKVARLLDAGEGWYRISYGKTEGYISTDGAEPVHYADYEGTAATATIVEELVDYAYTYLGTPYVYAGSGRSGTDCSGFTMAVYAAFGYNLPHSAVAQYARSTHVSMSELEAGDLVFFNMDGTGISHVGLYVGGGYFVHASDSRGVTTDYLYGHYSGSYVGAGRILP